MGKADWIEKVEKNNKNQVILKKVYVTNFI